VKRSRRVVAFLLLFTIGVSSIEVLLGDEPAADGVASSIVTASAAATIDAPKHGDNGATDCACLCACVCPGAQVAVAPLLPSFEFGSAVIEVAIAGALGASPQRESNPPFRPPLT
jgi:hypothetical protein